MISAILLSGDAQKELETQISKSMHPAFAAWGKPVVNIISFSRITPKSTEAVMVIRLTNYGEEYAARLMYTLTGDYRDLKAGNLDKLRVEILAPRADALYDANSVKIVVGENYQRVSFQDDGADPAIFRVIGYDFHECLIAVYRVLFPSLSIVNLGPVEWVPCEEYVRFVYE